MWKKKREGKDKKQKTKCCHCGDKKQNKKTLKTLLERSKLERKSKKTKIRQGKKHGKDKNREIL